MEGSSVSVHPQPKTFDVASWRLTPKVKITSGSSKALEDAEVCARGLYKTQHGVRLTPRRQPSYRLQKPAFLLCVGAAAAAGLVGGYVCNMQMWSQCAALAAEFSMCRKRD